MTTFNDRERGEEARFRHDQELGFKVRNRRNKLFGLWLADEYLGERDGTRRGSGTAYRRLGVLRVRVANRPASHARPCAQR